MSISDDIQKDIQARSSNACRCFDETTIGCPVHKKLLKPKSFQEQGVSKIQLRMESELKALDGRQPGYHEKVIKTTGEYEARVQTLAYLRGEIEFSVESFKELDRFKIDDNSLRLALLEAAEDFVVAIPSERLVG